MKLDDQLRNYYEEIEVDENAQVRLERKAAMLTAGAKPQRLPRARTPATLVLSAAVVVAAIAALAVGIASWTGHRATAGPAQASVGNVSSPSSNGTETIARSALPPDIAVALSYFIAECRVDGDANPTNIQYVESTAKAAEDYTYPGLDSFDGTDQQAAAGAPAVVFQAAGNFTVHPPVGGVSVAPEMSTINSGVFELSDGYIIASGLQESPVDLSKLGTVVDIPNS